MPDDTPAVETGDTQFLTPESAAPMLEAFLFPAAADTNDTPEPTPDAEAAAETQADAEAESEADADAAPDEDAADAEAESEESPDAPDEPPQPRKYRVKVADAEEEVTEDELVKGYQRHADYTRKTQALADERKAFEAQQADVTARAERYAEALKQLEDALKVEEPDWDAVQREHPDQFPTLFANWQRQERQREIVKREREATEAKVAEERKQHFARALADERAKLFQAIPEWTDEATLTADRERMVAYAKERGFTDADIAGIVDHRVIQLWRDATLWRQAVQQKPTVEPKKAAPKKPAAPGGGSSTARKQPTEAERAANRLKRTGRVEDAAKVFEQFVI